MDNVRTSLNESAVFYTTRNGIKAYGVYDGDKFQLLDGSQIDISKKIPFNKLQTQRDEALKNGDIVFENGIYILKKSMEFSSPSAASCFVLGGSRNGWIEWKNQDGKTLDEIYRK